MSPWQTFAPPLGYKLLRSEYGGGKSTHVFVSLDGREERTCEVMPGEDELRTLEKWRATVPAYVEPLPEVGEPVDVPRKRK
jgi:hypothetical protein